MDHQWSKSRGPKAPRSSIVAVRSDVSLTTTTSLETEKPTHQLGFFGSIPLKSAISQLRILGIIFLCGPGMFAGITGLGGAGLSDPIPFNNSLIANYAASAVFGFIAAPICTRLAFKLSLMIGGAAFAFFSVSLLIYKQVQTGWILTLGGIINGVLGSLEWTARGSMMMTYPLLKEKGKHVSFSLTMFNLGAILCGLIVFLQNLHSDLTTFNTETYIGFVAIMSIAVPLALLIVSPKVVTRSDSSSVAASDSPSWTGIIRSSASRLCTDPHILALFPMFFVSNFYFPYIFNDVNLATFNVRTRALNVILFYSAGIAGANTAGYILDAQFLRRSTRVRLGLGILLAAFMLVWAGCFAWQGPFTRPGTESSQFHHIDCAENAYIGSVFLFLAFGFTHFVFQNCIFYFITALAKESTTAATADFAGFFKSTQALGVVVAWRLNNMEFPFRTDLMISWCLTILSILVAVPVLVLKVKDVKDVRESVTPAQDIEIEPFVEVEEA